MPDEIEKTIVHQIYVDDLLISSPSEEEAVRVVEEAMDRFKRYQLKFCKVSSNMQTIQDRYPYVAGESETQDLAPLENQPSDKENTGRSLGLQWNKRTDEFRVKTE